MIKNPVIIFINPLENYLSSRIRRRLALEQKFGHIQAAIL